MKKMIRTITAVGVILAFTGCASSKEHKDLAKELLEDKYDEEFVISKDLGEGFDLDEGIGRGFMTDEYSVEAYSEEYPEIIFDATVFPDRSKVSDTYAVKRILYSTARQIEDNLKGLSGKYYVHIVPLVYPAGIDDPEAGIEELVEDNDKNSYTVYFLYCPEDAVDNTAYQYVSNMFQGLECMSGKISFYVVDNKTLNKAKNYIEENKELYQEFRDMTNDGHKGFIEFKDGEPDMERFSSLF